jgi:NAD(P)-dependent dehydrogenase (short-subunit alcohol dehydrogenase family)
LRLTLASSQELDETLNVNVRGVFLSYKYAAAQMIKQGSGGRIIGVLAIDHLITSIFHFFNTFTLKAPPPPGVRQANPI